MGRTIGIDLGTTNTSVAVFEQGRPKVLADEKGYKVLPSVISQKQDGSYIVGQAAKNLILTDPDRTVYAIKRLIGRRFDSDQVQEALRRMPFQIAESPDGLCQVKLGDSWMSPVEVAAIVLQVAKQIAERARGGTVDEAVITVPAHFTHGQRSATMEAARLAGLRCDRLLNEPTAAALAYGHRRDIERNILIFDLGGGTFDVSILHLARGVYEVLATSGDSYLGGEDFDNRVVDWLAERFLSKHRVDLRKDRMALQRLKDAAERAKCELSFSDKANILVPRITAKDNLEEVLNRTQLEQLTEDLVARALDITRDAMRMASLKLSDIDDVVLVGGQTRMPRVRELIAGLFGRDPSRAVHPEEAVAIGAAVHGESLDNPEDRPALLIDVTPFDLGIDSAGGFFSTIVERNSRIPVSRSRTFTTARDNQDKVRITVRQGGSQVAKENEFLSEFVLTGIAPAPRMEPKLEVSFRIDANGLLHVSATDRSTGERQQVVVRNYAEHAANPHIPSPDEIAAEEQRRASDGGASDVAAPAPVPGAKKEGGGLSRLTSMIKDRVSRGGRGKKKAPAEAPAAAAVEPAPELPAIEPEPDEVPELDEAEVEAVEPEPEFTQPPVIQLAPPPRVELGQLDRAGSEALEMFDDFESLEDDSFVDADEFDEPEPAPTRASTPPMFSRTPTPPPSPPAPKPAPVRGKDALFGDDEDDHDEPTEDRPAPAAVGTSLRSTSADPRSRTPAEPPPIAVRGAPTGPSAASELDEGELAAAFLDQLESGSFEGFGDDLFADLANLNPADAAGGPGNARKAPEDLLKTAGGDVTDDLFSMPTTYELGRPDEVPRTGQTDITDLASLDDLFGSTSTPGAAKGRRPAPAEFEEDLFTGPSSPSQAAESLNSSDSQSGRQKKKPARLRISYSSAVSFGREYRENLRRGNTFIRSDAPLPLGRECIFDIRVPGVKDAVRLSGLVVWSSRDRELPEGDEPGMRIEYRLTDEERLIIENVLSSLGI